MGVNGKKDHVPVPMDKLAMAKQMAAKLTAKTATINKSEVGVVTTVSHNDCLNITVSTQVEKTTEGFVRGTGGAPGQSFSAKSVAGGQLADQYFTIETVSCIHICLNVSLGLIQISLPRG